MPRGDAMPARGAEGQGHAGGLRLPACCLAADVILVTNVGLDVSDVIFSVIYSLQLYCT
jgi:hypothetical protein